MTWRTQLDRFVLIVSLITGAVTHGYNLFNYPLYITDEGIYIQQAWSVLREARLSLYLITGGTDWRNGDLRIVAAILSGLTFGVAVLTKENAIFFAPVVGYLLFKRLQGRMNYRFSAAFWSFSAISTVSLYFLYA